MDERRELLALLREDARQDVADLARQTGLSTDRVEELLAELEDGGVVRGYQAVVDWDRAAGDHVRAMVELNVTLDRETGYEDIGERLARFPAVRSLYLVSGDFDFALEVEGESMREVSHFIAEEVAPVPEITQTVTHYVMTAYKEGGRRFDDDGDDDRLSVTP